MPTPAERQKLYIERLKQQKPEKYEAFKMKNAERTNRNRKRINDCQSVEEQNEMRKKWREDKKKEKEKKPIKVENENMPTPAERQKLYRERLKQENPVKFEALKKKNAERTNRNRRRINDCQSVEEQNEMRKKWREGKKKERENKPIEVENENKKCPKNLNKLNYNMKKENLELRAKVASTTKEIKKLRKKLNRIERKNNELLELIKQLRNENDVVQHTENTASHQENEMTLRRKTDTFIDQNLPNISIEEKKKVTKLLMEHNDLVHSLQECYASTQSCNSKRIIKSVVDCSIVEKHKMKGTIATYLGLKGKLRRIQTKRKNYALLNKLKEFFERDNERDDEGATAGKKVFKTFLKDKTQRRYLLDTLENLYKSEGGKGKLTL